LFKLKAPARGMNRLQQSRPGFAIYFDHQSDDLLRQLSMFRYGNTTFCTFAAVATERTVATAAGSVALFGPRAFSVFKMKQE